MFVGELHHVIKRGFYFLQLFVLSFAGLNCGNEIKQAAGTKNQKTLPVYKLAFESNSENFSFRFSIDTVHDIIEVATDSVDVMYRDFEIYTHYNDSIAMSTIINANYGNFTHYYIKRYALQNDSFELSGQAIADTYHLPLIIEILPGYSRSYTSPRSFASFPVDGIADSTDRLPEYHFYATQLAEVNFQTNDTATKILDDKLIDLNYDSVPERILLYNSKDGYTRCIIFENQNGKWILLHKMKYFRMDYAAVSTCQFSGMKNRSVILKLYYPGFAPRKRYFEIVAVLIPVGIR
ncbi:hypothetical protein BH11BAC7_BH11BAC7_27060 [soil metagenome]